MSDHHHRYPGIYRRLEGWKIALADRLHVMIYPWPGHVGIFESRPVVGEVLRRGDNTRLFEALDGGGAHEGDEVRVVPVRAAPDSGPGSRVYHGREVGVHLATPEFATYALRDPSRLPRVRPPPNLHRRRLPR